MDIQDYIFDKEIKLYCKKADSFPIDLSNSQYHVRLGTSAIPTEYV